MKAVQWVRSSRIGRKISTSIETLKEDWLPQFKIAAAKGHFDFRSIHPQERLQNMFI
jgi:hypothetical protein